ncbi:hypothetical protein V1478_009351 [Vespula squamosa]|uniref:Uncharacterized protein n=1 Tax=Vespula squamosa TaxID=30214 RepID=A0ABD2APE0_VESSQ
MEIPRGHMTILTNKHNRISSFSFAATTFGEGYCFYKLPRFYPYHELNVVVVDRCPLLHVVVW